MSANLSDFIGNLNEGFVSYCMVRLEGYGLSYSQYSFLEYLGTHPNCTPGELSTALHADNGHTTRTVNKMIECGMCTKQRQTQDKRMYLINLTPAGKKAYDEVADLYESWEEEMLKGLDESEKQVLYSLLRRLGQQ